MESAGPPTQRSAEVDNTKARPEGRQGGRPCVMSSHRPADEIRATSVTGYAVTNPATGEVVKEYPTATDAEIQAAIAAPRRLRGLGAHDDRRRAGRAGPTGGGAAHRAQGRTRRDHRRARWASRWRTPSARSSTAPRSTSTTPTTPRICWPTSRSSCSTERATR